MSNDLTPVYSPFSIAEVPTPDCAKLIYQEICVKRLWPRKTYPALPWAMEQLVGTTWRNIHCGDLTQVMAIQQDRWNNPVLAYKSEHSWGEPRWQLGLFWPDEFDGGRYVVEDWVRVDLLPAEDQLRWFEFHLGRINAQIALDVQRLAECAPGGDRVKRQWRIEDLARDRREAAAAEKLLRSFASSAGLQISAEIVNARRPEWQNR